MVQYNDNFFINLTMKLSEKDQDLYNQWALWCANSNNRYFIDGQVIEDEVCFFTNERTNDEIRTINYIDYLQNFLLTLDKQDPIAIKYIELAERFIKSNPKNGMLIPYGRFREIEENKK